MRRLVLILLTLTTLIGCSTNEETETETESAAEDKQEEMSDAAVKLYLNQMTGKYSLAFTSIVTTEEKNNILNEAITEINLAVTDIEDTYEKGVEPSGKLYKLADALLDSIDSELLGSNAYDSAHDAGVLIKELSDEYADGELPVGIKTMIEE